MAPDGKNFVFAAKQQGNWDIYSQRLGGRHVVNLTADFLGDDTQPSFSPEGDRIAFRSEREGGGTFIMGATGESVRKVVGFGYNPSWSPDGKRLVVATEGVSDPVNRGRASQLWAVEVDTGSKRLIYSDDAVQPNWSPHGERIAFWSGLSGRREVKTTSSSGGEARPAANDADVNWNPVWSPDGTAGTARGERRHRREGRASGSEWGRDLTVTSRPPTSRRRELITAGTADRHRELARPIVTWTGADGVRRYNDIVAATRTIIDEIRSFQVWPSRNFRVRRSLTLFRNSSLRRCMLLERAWVPPLKLRSLKTVARAFPNNWIEEMLSPKFPGRLSSLSPRVTQNRSPRLHPQLEDIIRRIRSHWGKPSNRDRI